MTDHKELFLFGRAVPSKVDENALIERVVDAANNRNRNGSKPTKAIASIPASDIQQIVVGQNSIGFLFSNQKIARLNFEIVENVVSTEKSPTSLIPPSASSTVDPTPGSTQPSGSGLTSSSGTGASQVPSGFGSSSSAANRTAKIRRMMIAARRPGAICGRTGVIVDRARATLPASSIPEELIAQAQVVLQGKSREVIVRELQRTNLNVNEAVNNLLSRDDDEDDLDEAGEYLHEELLSLLDAGLRGEGGAAAVIDSDSLYSGAEGYDFMISQDTRRRVEQKSKDRKPEITAPTDVTQENFKFAEELQYWHDAKGEDFPPGIKGFTKIAATYSSLYAIASNGKVYTWDWKSEFPSNKAHLISDKLEKEGSAEEKICDLEACSWRVVLSTNKNRVSSFVDDYCGESLGEAFYTGFIDLPIGLTIERLLVCPLYAAILTTNSKVLWWGVHPFVDRMQAFENVKKGRDDLSNRSIVIGSEVRTRAIPIYANGSVGVNFSSGIPLIGVLMESAWTLTETCRFRVFTPDQYAIYVKERQPETKSTTIDLNQRKRSAPSESNEGTNNSSLPTAQYKEDAWSLRQVTFFYEEPVCDTAVVKIIDGSFVGIVYKSAIEQNERENNGVVDEIQLLKTKIRLMRKDELITVPATKISRSPQIHQKKLTEIKIPRRVGRILSAIAENNYFRLLAEKTSGDVSIITTNSSGTDVSEQVLSIDPTVLTQCSSNEKSRLSLENYGDEAMLVLRDAAGSFVPLVPDSSNGFREPIYVGFGPTRQLAVGLRYLNPSDISCSLITSTPVLDAKLLRKSDSSKTANRLLLIAALIAPEPRTTEPKIDSLIQHIQYCDLAKVQQILKELEENADESERKFQILDSYTDGNRNVFHTAVMNAYSLTNRDQGDDYTGVRIDENGCIVVEGGVDGETKKDSSDLNTTEADAVSMKFDKKWQQMISNEPTLSKIMGSSSSNKTSSPAKSSTEKDQPMEEERRKELSTLPLTARQRQKNAILIISALASSKAVKPYFEELMRQRDLHSYTPFYSAIQMRAYSAALIMWASLYELEKELGKTNHETLSTLAFSGGIGNDSVLFLLCYNDTCSFTWTGESHINQDIFECKTCDLVGSLCCCTECAFTCHRDHDCKLKRTSPTAYCDCWEKCSCKALVSGNQTQRENLLNVLLENTNLITLMNSRNEHLLLFLARSVGRQLVEQENFPRSSKIRMSQAVPSSTPSTLVVPEHNLEPPKFAITALLSLLSRWDPVKSLLYVGVKEKNFTVPIAEDLFYLNEQSGASHLDKFIFTLLARCPETALDALLNTLVREANKAGNERDANVDEIISRFVRSVIRLFSFLCISSQQATNTTLAAISCMLGTEIGEGAQKYQLSTSVPTSTPSSSSAKSLLPSYRTITVSGVLSLVRTSLPISFSGSSAKENKKKQINNFVLKCRRVFQVLITYSLTELLNSSDALIAPVRLGVTKQSLSIHRCTGSDPLDYIEKYLYTENEYSSALSKSSSASKHKKSRFRNQVAEDETRAHSQNSDGSDSDDDSENQRRPVGSTFATNIAENVAENAISEAFRDAIQENADEDDHLSDDSITSASDHDEDEMNQQHDFEQGEDLEQSGEESGDEHENYLDGDDEENHYFHIDQDESGEDYSDQEHYSSGEEGEGSPMYEHNDEPAFVEGSERRESNRAGRRKNHSRRHRRSTTNQSTNQNAEEPMEQGEATNANSAQNADNVPAVAPNASSTQNAVQPPAINDNSISAGQETSSRSQPRTISTFRNLFTTESSSPNRTTQATTGQTSYSTQSPSIGWAVRRVRQQNDGAESASTDPTNAASNERSSTLNENNNAPESAAGIASSRHTKSKTHYTSSENDVFQTKIQLAASFSLMIKLVDELFLRLIQHEKYSSQSHGGISKLLELESINVVANNFKNVINERVTITWEWFAKIMDKIEVMLRFGNALLKSPVGTEISPDSHSAASLNQSRNEKRLRKKTKDEHSSGSKREFFGYFMSLMRSHTNENGDEMPFIDPNPFRHIALLAEAYLFHMNIADLIDNKLKAIMIDDDVIVLQSKEVDEVHPKEIRRFYRRSESISYPFITSAEAQHAFKYKAADTAPLATRSSILKPDSDRSDLFMLPTVERTASEHISLAKAHGFENPTKMSIAENPIRCQDVINGVVVEEPMQVDLARFDETDAEINKGDLESLLGIRVNSTRLALAKTLGRWGNAMSYLAKAFSDDIVEFCGNDSFNSILLNELGGFLLKHSHFKARMEKYKSGLTKDINFSQLTRDKHKLISDVFVYLNTQYSRRTTNSSSSIDTTNTAPLGANRVKATFINEPGEGSGVVRSFYTAFAESIMEMEYLPKEDFSGHSNSRIPFNSRLDSLPLFSRTPLGFLTPIPGSNSTFRKNGFRNVGRIIGLCLQQMEIFKFPLCRHVLKFILNRPITWYDLIFYDSDMFDSLRSIVYDDQTNEPRNAEFYNDLGLSFVIDVPQAEGGGVIDLKPGGDKIAVSKENVLEYVYLFVQKRLLGDHIPALEELRNGVFDCIPADSLRGLTSEDLRLILCGTEQVSIRLLETFTTFMDESSSEPKMLQKMKNWFFRVIEQFTDKEKQDLLFFWTGSPSLPPTEEAFTPLPTVMLRPADDVHLVTANTCISRLYLPLYSSKKILRAKLLMAIKCRDFGFV